MKRKLLHLALYQAGWFACILGAAVGRPWVGPVAAAALLGVHLLLVDAKLRELAMAGSALPLGLAADGALLAGGAISFAERGLPLWMPALWVLLATLFSTTLDWLSGRYALALALGAAGGPLAYLAGARLGALELAPGGAWVVLLEWALALPALVWISDRLRARMPRRALV